MGPENQELSSEQLDYVDSFAEPADFDFLSEAQKKTLDSEQAKLDRSLQHYKAVFGDSNWSEQIDKDILKGDIYSIQQAIAVTDKLGARNWSGARVDIDKSLVSPTGQRVIMSKKCADKLGLIMDSYISKASLPNLTAVLAEEGVETADLTRVKAAAEKYGVIVLQNGIYAVLKPLLADFLSKTTQLAKPEFRAPENRAAAPSAPVPPRPQPAPQKSAFEAKLAAISAPAPHGEDLDALKRKIEQERKNSTTTGTQELKREVQTPELPSIKSGPAIAPRPSMPKPAPAPSRPLQPAPVPSGPAKPAMPLRDLNAIQIVDDLKRVEVGHLRQGPIQSQLQLIKNKILMLAQANRLVPYYAVTAFEQSPLFKAYLQVGGAMLHEAGTDRFQAFKMAATSVGADLTLPEFEAIADLRKEIERL